MGPLELIKVISVEKVETTATTTQNKHNGNSQLMNQCLLKLNQLGIYRFPSCFCVVVEVFLPFQIDVEGAGFNCALVWWNIKASVLTLCRSASA